VAANHINQHGIKHFALGDIVWKASGGSTIKIALIDEADDTPLDTDEFRAGAAGGTSIEETSGAMTLIDAAIDGVLDANDVTFVATTGDTCEGVYMYKDTGAAATDLSIAYWGSTTGGQGLPVTLGGDVTVAWNASGILKI